MNPLTLTYGSYYYKGVYISESCSSWNNYFNQIQLPSDSFQYKKIVTYFEVNNFDTKLSQSVAAVCRISHIIESIIQSLISGITYEAYCEGNLSSNFKFRN